MQLRASVVAFQFLLLASAVYASGLDAGKRLYREGFAGSGGGLRAVVSGDVPVSGRHWSCATCHGRSGLGGIEGGILVPAITADALFHPPVLSQTDRFASLFEERQTLQFRAKARNPRVHPPYTEATLANALRRGIDPAGHALDPAMPRYQLTDEDLASLCAYLESLGSSASPGVDDETLHFATVITDGVAAADRKSLLSILEAWFRQKNIEADYQKRRRPSWDMEEVYRSSRRWKLQIWELKGTPETWSAQLAAYYQRQPVFAVIGGLADGPWRFVGEFCDRFEVPCLFPATIVPSRHPQDGYTVYFSMGVAGEAAALAAYLRQKGVSAAKVVQVYRESYASRAAAEAFRAALQGVSEQTLPTGPAPAAQYWRSLLKERRPQQLVVWADDRDLENFDCAAMPVPVFFSASLMPDATRMASCESVHLTYPYALTDSISRERARMRNWQDSRGIPASNEGIQLNAQFAVKLLDYCLGHMRGRFSREYLLETIERETENAPNPGIFPQLTLGPGQRVASKGAYIARPGLTPSGVQPVSDWIVP